MVQYLLGRAVASWMDAFSSPLTFPPSRVGRAGFFARKGTGAGISTEEHTIRHGISASSPKH